MAAPRATHACPIWGGNQGIPGRPEPGITPSLPPGANHHHWRPKRCPHGRRPHQPTHSNPHCRPGPHAPTGLHRPHGRNHRHTLPLPPPGRHPPLLHRHVLPGPNHGARSRGYLRGPPAHGHGAPSPINQPHHPQPTLHLHPPCLTTPSPARCVYRRRTTTAPSTGITGPCTPSCAAPMHKHSPRPCARQHKPAAWNATPATREHHRI